MTLDNMISLDKCLTSEVGIISGPTVVYLVLHVIFFVCLGTSLYQPGATSQRFHFHSDEANSHQGFLIVFEQVYHC
jgi:hypothetical protein